MLEHEIQNQIRLAISDAKIATSFRTNVGEAWQGDVKKLDDGSLLIRNPRRFQTGLPPGFSDLFCVVPVTITPDMVGKQIAQAAFLEVKTPKGRATNDQRNFLQQMKNLGAIAAVVRSADNAITALRGGDALER